MRTRGTIGVILVAVCATLWAASVASAQVSAKQAALAVGVTDDVGGLAQFGSTVTFTYTVVNTGDETVMTISVDDTLAGHVGDIVSLAPGQSASFSVPVLIEGAAAGGVGSCSALGSSLGGPVSASADYGVEVFMADNVSDYAVTKQALSESASPGGVVRYRLRVRVANAGIATNVTLVDDYDEKAVAVVDAGGGTVSNGRITWPVPGALYEGERYSVECSFQVRDQARGTIDNVAVLESEDPDPNESNDSSKATIRVLAANGAQVSDPVTGTPASTLRARSAGEPFLPFTGPPEQLVSLFWLFGGLGYALRRFAA